VLTWSFGSQRSADILSQYTMAGSQHATKQEIDSIFRALKQVRGNQVSIHIEGRHRERSKSQPEKPETQLER